MSRGSCVARLLILLALLLPGPAGADNGPTLPLSDDLELAGLVRAAETSLRIMEHRDGEQSYELCGHSYSLEQLRQALQNFTAAARTAATTAEVMSLMRENFRLCRSNRPGRQAAFLTGYYEPEVAGSLEKSEKYRYPLYSPPGDLVRVNGRQGRLVNGELQPYWSRGEIEEKGLLAGYEVIYLADPLEAFVLHVQGSGRVRLPDGRRLTIDYAAKSGREYRSIGRLLLDEGKLSREEADLPGILAYLRAHPEEISRVLHHNESYIFFHLGHRKSAAPVGSFGLPLTAGRSLALDQRHYPPGTPAYLAAVKPVIDHEGEISDWRPFGRLVFNQDSGSAIQGPGRVDLFWGEGHYAEIAAGVTRHEAELFLLLPLVP